MEIILHPNTESNINDFIDNKQIIFFFKHEDEYYGASEDSRLVFAGIKDGTFPADSEFIGIKLKKNMEDPKEKRFSKKDIKSIKVVDERDAIKGVKSK